MSVTLQEEWPARASAPEAPHAPRAGDALRVLVIAGVLLLLLTGAPRRSDDAARVVEVSDRVLADAPRTSLLVRTTTEPPGQHALDALAAMAAHAPLLAALPDPPRLALEPPAQPVEGRAAALRFFLSGSAGERARVDLRTAAGVLLDSAFVQFDPHGRARGAFRVRPPGAGWHEWQLTSGTRAATTGAWVQPARAPRVLVAAGPPDAETRFIVRALEEAGMAVDLRQPLGHGLTPGATPAAITGAAELNDRDVVVLLNGAAVNAAGRDALARFVERGGGLLVAGRDPLLQQLGLGSALNQEPRQLTGNDLRWQLPAELVSLPAGSVQAAADVIAPAPGALAVASTADAGILVLRALGHGRTAALGLRETWRWRATAGAIEEHREFWRSLADWLAPPPESLHVEFAHPFASIDLRVHADVDAAGAPPVTLLRADGSSETLHYQRLPGDSARLRVSFIPRDTGVHRLTRDDGSTMGAVRALADVHHEPAARLTLLADMSGGRVLPAPALEDTLSARGAALPRHFDWRTVLFSLVLTLALLDWALRRARGCA